MKYSVSFVCRIVFAFLVVLCLASMHTFVSEGVVKETNAMIAVLMPICYVVLLVSAIDILTFRFRRETAVIGGGIKVEATVLKVEYPYVLHRGTYIKVTGYRSFPNRGRNREAQIIKLLYYYNGKKYVAARQFELRDLRIKPGDHIDVYLHPKFPDEFYIKDK